MNITLDDTSPLFQFVSINNNNSWIVNHTGFYVDPYTSDYFDGTFHGSFTQGDYMTLTFNGTAVYLYGAKRQNHGLFSVSVDGGDPFNQVGYFNGNEFQQLLYSQEGLSGDTTHTIKLTAMPAGTSVAGVTQSSWWVDVDYAVITTSTTGQVYTTKFDDTSPYFTYAGAGWNTGPPFSPSSYYNTTAHIDTTAGGSVGFNFNGSSVGIYGGQGENHGNYTVDLDGIDFGPYNGSFFTFAAQTPLFIASGLEDGPHSLTVHNIGQNGANQNDFDIDYAVVNSTHNPSGAITTGNSTGTNTTSSQVSGSPSSSSSSKSSTPTGAIVGGVVGGLAALALIAFAAWWFLRRKRQTAKQTDSRESPIDLNGDDVRPYYASGYEPGSYAYGSTTNNEGSTHRSPNSAGYSGYSDPDSMQTPQMQQTFHGNGSGSYLQSIPPPPASNATSYPHSVNPPSTVGSPTDTAAQNIPFDTPLPEGASHRSATAISAGSSAARASSGVASSSIAPASVMGASEVQTPQRTAQAAQTHKAATVALPFTASRPTNPTPTSPDPGSTFASTGSGNDTDPSGRIQKEGRAVDARPVGLLEEDEDDDEEYKGPLPPDYEQATQPLPGQTPTRT